MTDGGDHDEATLPQWARRRLDSLRKVIEDRGRELSNLRDAHTVLLDREWFTLPGPTFQDKDVLHLWYLERDDPRQVCALGRGDVLLIGKKCRDSGKEPECS